MTIDQIREIAKCQNIKVSKIKKSDLVRAIQQVEGNPPCSDTNSSDLCGQATCLWREDCK
jgi:hypothetical protein